VVGRQDGWVRLQRRNTLRENRGDTWGGRCV
jgi:hypothetical protein